MLELSLGDKQAMVQSLWNAVNNGGAALSQVPKIISNVLKTEAWKDREVDGKVYHNNSFFEFITAMPVKGCGWEVQRIEPLLRDDDIVLQKFRAAVTGEHGGDRKSARFIKSNNITLDVSERGTRKAYTLDRLKRKHKALFDKVVAGELSANAAAIEAGFRKKLSPLEQILKLLPKLSAKERTTIIEAIRAM